jgi:predicted unusual protein kinase regulating ubiquinone biosynthesis (AarF/ABC1/UbiB family)
MPRDYRDRPGSAIHARAKLTFVKTTAELGELSRPVALPEPTVGRPPRGRRRYFIAYVTTFRIVVSYLSLRLQARFRSPAVIDDLTRKKNLKNARRIHRTISRLQGLFIKIGQLISIMTNYLPEEFRAELETLQDQVPPRPYADVEQRFREEFDGKSPKDLFAEFEARPIASASIGQVHRARLSTGESVAVKVQYPDIEEIVRIDLRTLSRIFRVIGWFIPYQGLDGIYREVRAMILQELDFRAEADNVERIATRFVGRRDVAFPTVRRELSTGRILTTEWIDGVKVSDRARLAALGVDRARLARAVVTAYCQQIFTDGIYHADPHPGNLMVRRAAPPAGDVTIVFIDFGAVAEVSPRMRRGIADLIQAALARDTPRLVQAMKDMGFIARGADPAIFDKVIDFLHQKFQEEIQLESFSLKDVKFDPEKSLQNLADLRRMDVSIKDLADHFHVPKEWILLERTVLLLMGLCTELDPALNPMDVIRPYLEEFVLGKDRDWSALFVDTTKDIAASVLALPSEVKKFLQRAQRGELEVRFRGIDEHARLLYTLGHQIIWTALGITSALVGLSLDGRGEAAAARWAWTGAGTFGSFLLLSMLSTRARLKRRRR